MRVRPFVAALILSLGVPYELPAQDPQLAPNAPHDKPGFGDSLEFARMDSAFVPYVARARTTYPAARRRFEAGLPPRHGFFLVTRLEDSLGRMEQVFIAVDSIRGSTVFGKIWSQIALVQGYALRQPYSFDENRIIDWMISRPDGSEEGNVVGRFMEHRDAGANAPTRLQLPGAPFGIGLSNAGVMYVTLRSLGGIVRFDLPYLTPTGSLRLGAEPIDVGFTPSGSFAFVTHGAANKLTVIDPALGSVVDSIAIPGKPFRVIPSLDGSRVFVTTNEGQLVTVDAATRKVLGTRFVGGSINGFAARDSLLYLSSGGGGTVYEVNPVAGAILRTFTPGGVTQGLAAVGQNLYVATEPVSNEKQPMRVIDLKTGSISQLRGMDNAFDLALVPGDSLLYATFPFESQVKILDTRTRRVVRTIVTEGEGRPRRIALVLNAFGAKGVIAVVTNETGWVDFLP